MPAERRGRLYGRQCPRRHCGPGQRWAVEVGAQNLFNTQYAQVAFNSPFQEGARTAAFADPQFPGGRQIFSAYLAEPRTYGITLRGKF